MGHSIGPEEMAALTTHGDDRILEQAEVVLGVGVALPVAERAKVLGADVRDAGGVPDDLDVVCALLAVRRFLAERRGGGGPQHQSRGEHRTEQQMTA